MTDRVHILIVDDERDLASRLRADGYLVDAVTLERAERFLEEHDVGVVILDPRKFELADACGRLRPDAVLVDTLTGASGDEHASPIVASAVEIFGLRRANRRLREQLDPLARSLRDTVGVLVGVLDSYDPHLGMHCKRVAKLAEGLGREMGLDETALRELEFAALLHDVGKISRLHMLTTPSHDGRTAHFEESSAALLRHVSGFEEVARIVRHHAERYDGSGRPDGLVGEAIPLASRIICVANHFDKTMYAALQPTHPDLPAARDVIEEGAGVLFDPVVSRLLFGPEETPSATNPGPDAVVEMGEVEVSPREIGARMVLTRDLRNINEVLLLAAGTTITADHVQKIRVLAEDNMLEAGIHVACDPVKGCPVPHYMARKSA